jgi:hypothetical protein
MELVPRLSLKLSQDSLQIEILIRVFQVRSPYSNNTEISRLAMQDLLRATFESKCSPRLLKHDDNIEERAADRERMLEAREAAMGNKFREL